MRSLAQLLLSVFVLSCVFDPADTVLGLKMPLFALIVSLATLKVLSSKDVKLPLPAVLISAFFVMVPSLAVLKGMGSGLVDASVGFAMLKGYLLILLYPATLVLKLDLLSNLVKTLLVLSIVIIASFIYVQIEPDFYTSLYNFGNSTGVVLPDRRSYGGDAEYLQVYYVTSPMILIAIARFFSHAYTSRINGGKWVLSALACLLCLTAILLAGTRNNLITSLMLVTSLLFLHSTRRSYLILLGSIASFSLAGIVAAYLSEFFNPEEYSNSIKLMLVLDYLDVFTNVEWLLFGQGLGADIFWSARQGHHHLSELTYLELIRNFGLLGAAVIALILISPFFTGLIRVQRTTEYNDLLWAYAFYLIACATNPNLFSSMGILILVTLLSYGAAIRSRSEPTY